MSATTNTISMPSVTFVSILKALSCAMSKDTTRPYLMGIYVDIANKRMCATDGHRLHVVNLSDRFTTVWGEPLNFFLNSRNVKDLVKSSKKGSTVIVVKENLVTVTSGDIEETIKTDRVKYPPIDGVLEIPKDCNKIPLLNPSYMSDAYASIVKLAGGKGYAYEMHTKLEYFGNYSPARLTASTDNGDFVAIIMPRART